MRVRRKLSALELFRKYHTGMRISTAQARTLAISFQFVPETHTMTQNTAMYTSAVPTSGCARISTIGSAMNSTSGMMSRMCMTGFMRTEKALAKQMIMMTLPSSEGWKPRSLPQVKKALMPPRPASTPSTNSSISRLMT